MKKQALIIGLGQFGMALAHALSDRGIEVIAVDRSKDLVHAVSTVVDQAMCLDATEEGMLARLAPEKRDVCICAIGNESREGSIIVTALLRQLGAPHIVARATDDLMERILKLVGAHETVNPERSFGERLATRLIYDRILEEVPIAADLVVTNFKPLASMVGRSLIDLGLPKRFGLTVVAVMRVQEGHGQVSQPDPRRPIESDDVLVVVGAPGAVQKLAESW